MGRSSVEFREEVSFKVDRLESLVNRNTATYGNLFSQRLSVRITAYSSSLKALVSETVP